jgi:hypothetical protein
MRDSTAAAAKKAFGSRSCPIHVAFYGTKEAKRNPPAEEGRGMLDLREKDPVAPPR